MIHSENFLSITNTPFLYDEIFSPIMLTTLPLHMPTLFLPHCYCFRCACSFNVPHIPTVEALLPGKLAVLIKVAISSVAFLCVLLGKLLESITLFTDPISRFPWVFFWTIQVHIVSCVPLPWLVQIWVPFQKSPQQPPLYSVNTCATHQLVSYSSIAFKVTKSNCPLSTISALPHNHLHFQ